MTDLLRRLETRALLLWIAVAGSVWAFLSIGGEITEGESLAFDRDLLLALRNPGDLSDPLGPPNVEEIMRDITALGGVTVLTLVTVVGALVFVLHRRRVHAAVLVVTMLAAQACASALKAAYGRPRPDLVPHGVEVYSASFPSGHSMLSATAYLTLAMLISSLETQRGLKMTVFVLALILMITIGVSRVYLGVHWPSDVLGGWCVGAAWAMAAWMVLRRVTRLKPERP